MITGNDEKSLWAIEKLRNGWKPAQLMEHGFTESQSKKLSQFTNCLIKLEEHTQPEHVEKWKALGLKGLVLLSMFKEEDWDGLMEVLSAVDPQMKRSEIAKYPDFLIEKRARLAEVERHVKFRIMGLEKKKEELLQTIEQAEKEREVLKKQLPDWTKDIEDADTLDFLLDHLGMKDGKLCLAKRLDYRWQNNLRKKGILSYKGWDVEPGEKEDFTHWVNDVKALAEEYQKRKKRGYRTEYDPDAVPQNDWIWWDVPYDAEYSGIQSLAKIKGRKLTKEKKRINEIEQEIAAAEEELKEFRKRRPESFSEALNRSNQFASYDMEKHGGLQELGLKWLYNQGYAATTELTLPGNLRCDVIGVNEKGEICILECKASLEDYQRDDKWQRYLKYCDRFYFVAEPWLAEWMDKEEVGILKAHQTYLEVFAECPPLEKAEQAQETAFAIARQLSRRFVFGY